MKTEESTFAAVYKDGSFVQKDTLKEIIKLENVFFYLKIDFHHKHTTRYGNTYYFNWFKIIDSSGQNYHFTSGEFEVIEIGFERGQWQNNGMIIKILDKGKNKVFEFHTNNNGLEVFKNEIFPLLKKLNDLGNWESYKLYEKTLSDKKLIDELYNEIEKLKTKIEALEDEINVIITKKK